LRHFLCITTGLDVLPLLYAVSNQPHLWNQDTIRTQHPGSVHAAASDILLHFQPTATVFVQGTTVTDVVHECQPRPAWWALPQAQPLIFGLMARIAGTRLGRVMLTKLPPGGSIPPHVDSASQTDYYRRHHITLCSPEQCLFSVGDEALSLAPGSCFWVNNGVEHAVVNDGPTERISLIVDIHVPTWKEAPHEDPGRTAKPVARSRVRT
jgi:quercetin dioxygenase-like cupin family protein